MLPYVIQFIFYITDNLDDIEFEDIDLYPSVKKILTVESHNSQACNTSTGNIYIIIIVCIKLILVHTNADSPEDTCALSSSKSQALISSNISLFRGHQAAATPSNTNAASQGTLYT